MKTSLTLNNLSHHAYVLIGNPLVREELISVLEKNHSIPIQGNPDFYDRKYETFTIDDAREIKAVHSMRPIHESAKKIFVISMNGITVEAQNAMLKLLEEPAEYANFFLIIPSEHLLLPTVRSRVAIIQTGDGAESGRKSMRADAGNSEANTEAKKFIASTIPKRLETIKKLTEDITKEKRTKQDAIEFLNEIEATVYSEKGIRNGRQALEAIEQARNYAGDRAPSLKMLLEYVAMNI